MARPGMKARKVKSRQAGSKGAPPSAAATLATPEIQVAISQLKEAALDVGLLDLFGQLAAETPGGPLTLIEALGGTGDLAAGMVLAAIATETPDKEQRKAARRALHKLRSAGLDVTVPVAADHEPTFALPREALRIVQALVSPSDGVGSRMLWLLLERPHGGLTMFGLVLNDIAGLKGEMIEEISRRRFDISMQEWGDMTGYAVTEVPVEYGLALLSEALALNAESGFPLPREFVIRRSVLGELPPPPSAALIHQHISRGQTLLVPDLLEQSASLLEEPELDGWSFGYSEVQPFAREYQQAGKRWILLASDSNEAQQQRALDKAVDALFTPAMRRGLRRRLEETAYIFWKSGRDRAARQAVAAAFAITDAGSLRSHPLLRTIVQQSIEMAIRVDESGLGPPPGADRSAYTPI